MGERWLSIERRRWNCRSFGSELPKKLLILCLSWNRQISRKRLKRKRKTDAKEGVCVCVCVCGVSEVHGKMRCKGGERREELNANVESLYWMKMKLQRESGQEKAVDDRDSTP
jgi:hypothetical protein